jgi:hypothetical protein
MRKTIAVAVAAVVTLAGAATASAAVVPANDNWGVVNRNVIGAADAQLRTGPAPTPFGVGSLNLSVASANDKIAYGNEVDYAGDLVSDLTAVGFHVYTTGENSLLAAANMPSITFEIDPNGAGNTTTSFSSLVYTPAANSASNQWSPFIDATTTGFWGLTGTQFNSPATADNCGINGPRCTFAQVKAFLATGTGATIYTAQITKGRDNAWHGAVDGLVINDTTIDFELPRAAVGPAGAAGAPGAQGAAGGGAPGAAGLNRAAAPASVVAGTSQTSTCTGARLRVLRAAARKGERLVMVRASLRGKKLKVDGRRIAVNLVGKPQGAYAVRITARYRRATGTTRTVKVTRTLRIVCA